MKLATHLMTLSLLVMISICDAATGEFSSSSSSGGVVDIDGNEVKTGVEYNMLASSGGGFSLASTGCNPCPLDVVQESSILNPGLPLTFLPMNHHKPGRVVRLSTDLNINFNATSINSSCTHAKSTVWKLEHDRFINKLVVTTEGRLNGWFKFEKVSPPVYKLVFCPNSRDSCAPECGDLVFLADDQNLSQRRLFISSSTSSADERGFWVRIAKANYTQAPTNLMMNINGIFTGH